MDPEVNFLNSDYDWLTWCTLSLGNCHIGQKPDFLLTMHMCPCRMLFDYICVFYTYDDIYTLISLFTLMNWSYWCFYEQHQRISQRCLQSVQLYSAAIYCRISEHEGRFKKPSLQTIGLWNLLWFTVDARSEWSCCDVFACACCWKINCKPLWLEATQLLPFHVHYLMSLIKHMKRFFICGVTKKPNLRHCSKVFTAPHAGYAIIRSVLISATCYHVEFLKTLLVWTKRLVYSAVWMENFSVLIY